MTDPRERLRQTLALLRRELDDARGIDAQAVERLRSAAGEVQAALDNEQESGSEQPWPSERLTESATYFEQSHPTLSGTIRQLVDILGQMGI